MVWDQINDVIQIPGFQYHGSDVSKHKVLHCVARGFDPLGLVAPTTLYRNFSYNGYGNLTSLGMGL